MLVNSTRLKFGVAWNILTFSLASFTSLSVFAQDYPIVQMVKRNAASFAIDGNNGGANGQDVYLWGESESNVNQQWYEIDRGNGYYSFQKVGTNYCLDGNHGGADGQNVYLWTCMANNQNQQWLKVNVGSNYYRLEKRNASGFSLDGNQGGSDGQSVYLWTSNNNNQNQHWLFNYVSDDGGSDDCDLPWSSSNISINNETLDETLEAIDISCVSDASISMNVQGVGPMENADYLNVYYSVDGGTPRAMLTETNAFGQKTVSASGISGSTLEILVEGFTSYPDETYTVSNFSVFEDNGSTPPPTGTNGGATYVGGGGTVAGAQPHTCDVPSGFTTVNSLSAMITAMGRSNVKVALAPGTYSLDTGDAGLFTSQDLPSGRDGSTLFPVDGNNSQYDFRCTKINYDTDLWRAFGGDEVIQLRTVGNNNVISNLTIEDIGDTAPSGGALGAMMDGRDNVIEGSIFTSRGSQPYGLGDAYGKGGGPVLSHDKHSVILIRGLRNTLRQSTIFNYAYGHSVFMQASEETLIDRVYVQSELRSTADMLAVNDSRFADADARAAGVGFTTVWGYRLPSGYWMSLSEGGIRAYNGGITVIDGVAYARGAHDVTVLGSVIRHARTGIALTHATGTRYVEDTTVIECESGFGVGAGDIVDSYADANVGPVIGFAYSSDNGTNADITVLPSDGSKNGWGALAYIGGKNHNITLRSSQGNVNQNIKVIVSGDNTSIRHLHGALANQDNLTLYNTEINNLTNYPMVINDLAEDNTGQSNGPISGNTGENSIRQN
ncbi:MAG: RICIN domain-containing protein [Acidiferrobacterales bacterium]|nr:RICIN domain-containing protein [Acidiferrobacterales bacterium]